MKYKTEYPNLTVLLPGSCNAKCAFCFWNRNQTSSKLFVARALEIISKLPPQFCSLSISGGEPTLSPVLVPFLKGITSLQRKSRRFDRIVLTTNGAKLAERLPAIAQVVDHINISRHHFEDTLNFKAFGTQSVPTSSDLDAIIQSIHMTAMDVTLNCVISDDAKFTTSQLKARLDFVTKFINFAESRGADAVSFRKEASDTTPTRVEKSMRKLYRTVAEDMCPVCRGAVQNVNNFEVRWKGSVAEPSIQLGGIYEAVLHSDGKLYADWSRQVPINYKAQSPKTQKVEAQRVSGLSCNRC